MNKVTEERKTANLLEQFALLLNLLEPEAVEPAALPDDFEHTQPAYFIGIDIEVGNA
ncbi:hypothetical protein [Methylibium sp.]|uniref:hypothetical protein n=1 Tax=Methylibium sp. TaxID=2067992 RepID=UPI0017A156B7|nr:hypothetical protein [Methylibium sp.]MBA3589694.1 hypothetical protein [Methylibium sp.]